LDLDGIREQWRAVGLLLVVTCLALVPAITAYQGRAVRNLGVFPWLPVRHLSVGLAIVLSAKLAPAWLQKLAQLAVTAFVAIAPWSYGLYVLHFPLAANLRWLPLNLPNWASLSVYGLLGLYLCWWAEQKYQTAARNWLNQLIRTRGRSVSSE
jgi:peptidoglycan/LPS O-acetylase OafA/YrhL